MTDHHNDAYAGFEHSPPLRPFMPGHTPSSSVTSFHPTQERQPLVAPPPAPVLPQLYGPGPDDLPSGPLYTEKHHSSRKRKRGVLIAIVATCVVVLVAAGVAVALVIVKRNKEHDKAGSKPTSGASSNGAGSTSGSGSGTSTAGGAGAAGNVLLTGGDGTMVALENGTQFQYKNSFAGTWYWDAANPFKGGKANSWTPAIDEPWKWGEDKIHGVNLGGWLVLEPFITPAIFEKYAAQHVVDEWTLHAAMTADKTPGGGVALLEEHYKTFITEQDFAQIAGAGLNWVRLPLPFWAIEKWEDEPFIEKTCWTYFLKAVQWARKYGIRIALDLHALPGSQNGWNHSGRMLGNIKGNWLKGPMGVANAQRTLSYLRILTQFISQPQYANVVPMFGLVNEPTYLGNPALKQNDVLKHFYFEAYKTIRAVSGVGKGPVINLFDANPGVPEWSTAQFLAGADRVALDVHPYFAFGAEDRVQPADLVPGACKNFSPGLNRTWSTYGIVSAGEWSVAVNDCGKWVSQGDKSQYETKNGAGSCDEWTNYEAWSQDLIAGLRKLWLAQADSYGDWFYWTWRIGPSSLTNKIESPFWSYSLGLERGWIPTDPREAAGACAAAGIPQTAPRLPVTQMKPNQIGLAPSAAPTATAGLVWPPPALADQPDAAALPTFTPTGTIATLPVPTFTDPANPQKTLDAGTGWANPHDSTDGMYVPVRGCAYLPAWGASGQPLPAQCAVA